MTNFFAFLAWSASTAVALASASALARRFHPGDGPFRVVHVVVAFWAFVTAGSIALSAGHLLSGAGLLAAVPAVALASLGAARRFGRGGPAGAGAAPGRPRRAAPARWTTAAWVVAIGFGAGHVLSRGLFGYVDDFDSLMYHIPMVDYWLQAGGLYAPDGSHWSTPGGNELLGLWAVAPFSGDFLVTLNNIPAALVLGFGALELATLAGLRRPLNHVTALAVCANFVVINQLVDTENDVAVAALFVACGGYGFRYARRGRAADLAYGAVGLGLLCGVKYYALGYAAVAWAAVALLTAARRGARDGLRAAAVLAAVAAAVGGYWYARNALVSGSPFHPLGLTRQTDAFREVYPNSGRSSFWGSGRPAEVAPLAVKAVWRMSGPCQLTAVLAAPVVVAWLLAPAARAARRGRTGGRGADRAALALLILGSGAVLAVTPFALEDVPGSLNHLRWAYTPVRYGLSFVSLAVVGLAVLLQDLCGPARGRRGVPGLPALPAVALGVSAVYQAVWLDRWHEIDWAAEGFACVNALSLWAAWNLLGRLTPGRRAAAVAVGAALAVVVTAAAVERSAVGWEAGYVAHYNRKYETSVFRKLAAMGGEPRLCLLDYRCHAFFGPNRRPRLCQPNRVPSYDDLVRYLDRHGVGYVVARAEDGQAPAGWDAYVDRNRWLDGRPEFRRVHRDKGFLLYEFRRPAGPQGGRLLAASTPPGGAPRHPK